MQAEQGGVVHLVVARSDADLVPLVDEGGQVVELVGTQSKVIGVGQRAKPAHSGRGWERVHARLVDGVTDVVGEGLAALEVFLKAQCIKIDIGERGKGGRVDKRVHLLVGDAGRGARVVGVAREALERVDEQVLQGSNLGRLAAHAHGGAALALGGLLALCVVNIAAAYHS